MSEPTQSQAKTLEHRQSNSFIIEHVDRFVVTGIQSNLGTSIALTVGRDSVEISHEEIIPIEDGGGTRLTEGCINSFRLDVATLQMSTDAAKSLADAIYSLLKDNPQK